MHADNLATPFVAGKVVWSLRGFIPDSAFVQCDLDLQSLKAKRPYYTDKLAATTCIRVIYFLNSDFFGFQVSVI